MSDETTQPAEPAPQPQPAAEPTSGATTEPAPADAAPAPAAEGADGGDPSEPEKHRRAGGWQRKIERLERERELLLEQLATQRGQPQPPAPDKAKTPDQQAADFIAAEVEKRIAVREAQRQQEMIAAEFQRRTQEVRAALPDFDEVVSSADVPISPAVSEALLTSEHGPRIMYELATNPAELARISALPPLAAAREIGRLEAKASATAAPAKPNPAATPRKPAVPAPITPVTTRGPTATKDPSSMSYDEYRRWRDSQGGR